MKEKWRKTTEEVWARKLFWVTFWVYCRTLLIDFISQSIPQWMTIVVQRRILLIYDDAPIYTTQLSEHTV
jgi:hypothetical protein